RGEKVKPKNTSVELRCLEGVDPSCSEALAELISGSLSLSTDARYEMQTHINELMTNGFDHAKSKVGCYVCAQWYPAKKNLRISFADGGIGIFQSLRDSGKFPEISNDADAIRLAVKPGITTRKKQLGGFGFDYMRKYVRKNKGTLSIVSGNAKVNFYKNKIEQKNEPIKFEGTIVDIKVSPRKDIHLRRRGKNDIF
ncbi:MAG: ATP-binding protein, partial [Patescibacteria group bacterium]